MRSNKTLPQQNPKPGVSSHFWNQATRHLPSKHPRFSGSSLWHHQTWSAAVLWPRALSWGPPRGRSPEPQHDTWLGRLRCTDSAEGRPARDVPNAGSTLRKARGREAPKTGDMKSEQIGCKTCLPRNAWKILVAKNDWTNNWILFAKKNDWKKPYESQHLPGESQSPSQQKQLDPQQRKSPWRNVPTHWEFERWAFWKTHSFLSKSMNSTQISSNITIRILENKLGHFGQW